MTSQKEIAANAVDCEVQQQDKGQQGNEMAPNAADSEVQQKLEKSQRQQEEEPPLAKRPRVTSSFGKCETVIDLDKLPVTVTYSDVTLAISKICNGFVRRSVTVKADFINNPTALLDVSLAMTAGVPRQCDYKDHQLNRSHPSATEEWHPSSNDVIRKLHLLVAVRDEAYPDFSVRRSRSHDTSDVRVIVGPNAKEFNLNRAHLSVYSTYFQSMFYGNFYEICKKTSELKGINESTFELILRMIYPERRKISGDKNNLRVEMVEEVLPLAVFLGIETIIHECETFLATSGYGIIEKLRLAHRHGLQHLECRVTKQLADYEVAKQTVLHPDFHSLDHAVKEFVMEKLLARLP